MIGVLLTFLMLVIAMILDLKTREVGNFLWFAFGGAGLIIMFFENMNNFGMLFIGLLNVFVVTFVMLILLVLGRMTTLLYIGDADLKGMVIIAILNYSFGWFFSLGIFVLGLVLVLFIPLSLFVKNYVEKTKVEKVYARNKFLLYFLGRKTRITAVNPLFSTPLERIKVIGKQVKRELMLAPDIEPVAEFKRLKALVRQKKIKDEIWVTPLPPFMIFLLFAYLLVIVGGLLRF